MRVASMGKERQEPPGYKPPQSAKELIERSVAGERWFSGANLRGADLVDADLSRTNLSRADLSGAILVDANLMLANLSGADLSRTILMVAELDRANLSMADLRNADLSGANLSGANLGGANLSGANLGAANLSGADLDGARFDGARVAYTFLLDVDLSPFCEAKPPLAHLRESPVDFKAIVRSIRAPRLKDFLIRTGMPAIFAEYMIECAQTVEGSVFTDMMQSAFISYGAPDEKFARQLYEELHKNGVRTFLFSENAVPGQRLDRMMRQGVNEHDRVVLICSKASLDRKGVLNEIVETLARESRDGGAEYLIPIRLDDYVFTDWSPSRPDIAQAIRGKVVADFRRAKSDPAKFNVELAKLLEALKKNHVTAPPDSGASAVTPANKSAAKKTIGKNSRAPKAKKTAATKTAAKKIAGKRGNGT